MGPVDIHPAPMAADAVSFQWPGAYAADPDMLDAEAVDAEVLDDVLPPANEAADKAPRGPSMDEANILWTCLAAFLVFFMQAGFAMVESGLTSARNTVNILMKNLLDFSLGTVIFWSFGFALMFGVSSGALGTSGFFFDPTSGTGAEMIKEAGWSEGFGWAFLIFQTVFAATAATIVSGAVAERTRFSSYLVYSILVTGVVYPIFGSWAWGGLFAGGGWLEGIGFLDFAGSTVVHSVGGWAALAGALVVGPRSGRFINGKAQPMPGHSLPLAALGVFILWLGWFGFNPGSTTSIEGGALAAIAVTTNIAAAGGALAATFTSWAAFGKPDATFGLNGALAGLVAITAGCDVMGVGSALITGAVAGSLVVGSVLFFDKLRVDDPVGAISVHGVCGAWGTLAVGLFAKEKGLLMGGGFAQLAIQATGVAVAFVWALGISWILFSALKTVLPIRATPEDEELGLDLSEHGQEAYPDFYGLEDAPPEQEGAAPVNAPFA